MPSSSDMDWNPILKPGDNCWRANVPVEASGLLIDAQEYYRAFYEAALQARRYLLIAGWKFNSDVRLIRGKDADRLGGEVHFVPFLKRLVRQNQDLRVYVLAWDFSLMYLPGWEWFLRRKFERGTRGRIQFRFDSRHPVGASHHQKFVVVDGHAAFVGGLDFNADDYDDRDHPAANPERADSGKPPHPPYHDIQAFLAGPPARELTDYFKVRWHAVTGEALELPDVPRPSPITVGVPTMIRGDAVAFSRTHPEMQGGSGVIREIRQLYIDAVMAARELIYLENQYFSSQAVYQALIERFNDAARPRLEVVMIFPKYLPSWLETVALGPPRLGMIDGLREAARQTGHRLGIYYSSAGLSDGVEVPVVIHSKLLIVDDRFLTVGSANTSNRSMSLDSELNVSWETGGRKNGGMEELIRSIKEVRIDLLAEHCGERVNAEFRAALGRRAGLVELLDGLADRQTCRLRRLTAEALVGNRAWLNQLRAWGLILEPHHPAIQEDLHERRPEERSLMGWFRQWVH